MAERPSRLRISALGGSVGSDGVLEAPVKVFRQFEELDSLGEDGLDGAIAFFNRPMDPLMISAGGAYGGPTISVPGARWKRLSMGAWPPWCVP